jgi:hypothetical protein
MKMRLESLEPRILFNTGYLTPGDANFDGRVDDVDLDVVAANWGKPAMFAQGDFDRNGVVDIADLDLLAGNWRKVYSVADPATGWLYRNMSDHPAFANGPQYTDAVQGALGDCWLIAAISSIAYQRPDIIQSSMVTPLGDGTYAVRFYKNYLPYDVRVDTMLPGAGYPTQLLYANQSPGLPENGGGELWVPLVEKAYAEIRNWSQSYESLTGGWMDEAYAVLLGVPTRDTGWPTGYASQFKNYVQGQLDLHRPVTLGTGSWATTLVGDHAYVLESVSDTTATLYNPWGREEVVTVDQLLADMQILEVATL